MIHLIQYNSTLSLKHQRPPQQQMFVALKFPNFNKSIFVKYCSLLIAVKTAHWLLKNC